MAKRERQMATEAVEHMASVAITSAGWAKATRKIATATCSAGLLPSDHPQCTPTDEAEDEGFAMIILQMVSMLKDSAFSTPGGGLVSRDIDRGASPPSLYSIAGEESDDSTPVEVALREALAQGKNCEARQSARQAVLMVEMERLAMVSHADLTSEAYRDKMAVTAAWEHHKNVGAQPRRGSRQRGS